MPNFKKKFHFQNFFSSLFSSCPTNTWHVTASDEFLVERERNIKPNPNPARCCSNPTTLHSSNSTLQSGYSCSRSSRKCLKMSRSEELGETSTPRRGEPPPPPLSSAPRMRAQADTFLVTCRVFSFITSLAAILCIAVNVYSAFRSFRNGYDVIPFFCCLCAYLRVIVRYYKEVNCSSFLINIVNFIVIRKCLRCLMEFSGVTLLWLPLLSSLLRQNGDFSSSSGRFA